MSNGWLTYQDAAQLVCRSAPWVRENANRGLIRRVVLGPGHRRPMVDRQDVVDLAAKLDAARARDQQMVLEPFLPAEMVSIVAAAQILGCNRSYVHALGKQGLLTIHRGRPFSWAVEVDVHRLLREWYGGYDPAEVMTYVEAAAALGLPVHQVRLLVMAGQLSRVGQPRHIRLLRAEVEAMRDYGVGS